MLDIAAFSECIKANLKDKRYGAERSKKILDEFKTRADAYQADGKTAADAGMMAMRDTFDNITLEATEKAKRTAKVLAVQAGAMERISQGLKADSKLFGKKNADGKTIGSRGKALGHAVKAIIAPDKRFSGISYFDLADVLRRQAFALMGDHLDKVTVGAFGRQKGKAHLPNIVREMFGHNTGDVTARELAKGWLRVSDFLVDSFNAAGGSMRKLERYLPQAHNAVKLLREGVDSFVKDHLDSVDWTRTRWPDGKLIKPEERQGVLEAIFQTQSSDGANKLDATALRGRGRAVGNALDNHRFLHYKDAEAWLAMHEKYGDGNVFDVMVRHISDLTHKTALVETLGPNPEMAMRNIQTQATILANKEGIGQREVNKMNAVFKNTVDPLMEVYTRANPMNPESGLALAVNTLSNLTTSAVLGSVALASTLGDLATTAVIRRINKMPMTGGMHFYFDSILTDRAAARQLATSSGWIFDQSINHMYGVERFNSIGQIGAEWSRRTSDVVLRASGMVPLTSAARFRAQAEFTVFMAKSAKQEFDAVPFASIMKRYGITAEDWNAFRSIKAHSPSAGVNMLRPMDVLSSDIKGDKTALFRKFQTMVLSEARGMVPDSTTEATLALKGTTRPDTLRGAILHSFAMYKNFPLTFMQTYGQYAMTTKTAKGRLGFVAGLGAATTVAGAMAVQLNEIKNGRDPRDMTDPKFWVSAFLKGGGAGIWGDFLYQSTNDYGGGPAETIAGPVTSVAGGALGVVLGAAADLYDAEDMEDYGSKQTRRLVDFTHRYTPGSNLWYAQQAFNKLFWEHLENAADPEASQKRERRADKQLKRYGNESYWEQGEGLPNRGPDLSKAFGGE